MPALHFVLALALTSPAAESLERDQVVGRLGARLDARLTRFAEYGFSGAVLVVRDSRIVLLKGYGLADRERGIPNTAATRFEMNSMTKMFTGVAILRLDAERRLGITDPVERHLGAFPPGKQGATIEQLATHTSGLIVRGTELAEGSRDAFVHDVERTPPESPPGERYRYTNAGFSLLAAIIEVVSGETYEEYLRRHLFEPAGMKSATFRDQVEADDPRFAHGYVGTPAAVEPGPANPYVWGTRGAGGVWATLGDMYRWLEAVAERRVLPEAQWRVLMRPPRPPAEEAFGWHVETDADGRRLVQKGGGSDDFASHLLYYPRQRVVIVWACNDLRQRWRHTLNRTLPALVLGGDTVVLPSVAALTQAELEGRAGRYSSGREVLELRAGSGYLYAAPNRLAVPTDVMFFPQDAGRFTGFDPASRTLTRLRFGGSGEPTLTVELPDGRRVRSRREARSSPASDHSSPDEPDDLAALGELRRPVPRGAPPEAASLRPARFRAEVGTPAESRPPLTSGPVLDENEPCGRRGM